jgi:hypothetical protein
MIGCEGIKGEANFAMYGSIRKSREITFFYTMD